VLRLDGIEERTRRGDHGDPARVVDVLFILERLIVESRKLRQRLSEPISLPRQPSHHTIAQSGERNRPSDGFPLIALVAAVAMVAEPGVRWICHVASTG
jgi:hypothetical protein